MAHRQSTAPLFDAVVVFDYEAVEPTELSVSKGQLVQVKEINESGWCLVKTEHKGGTKTGWIPLDYCDKVDVQAATTTTTAAPAAEATATPETAPAGDAGGVDEAAAAVDQLKVTADGAAAESKETCWGCKQPIVDRFVVAKDKTFHVEHFNCAKCDSTLAGQPFIEKDGGFYCEECFYRTFNPPCAGCTDVIRGKYITALEQSWHPECFTCSDCNKAFTGSSFRKNENKPYCDDCYNKSFGVHCSKCNQSIDGQVFEALGKKFHLDCFVCEEGGHAIGEQSHFHVYEEKVYCPDHFEALFLQKCSKCSKVIAAQYVKVMDDHFHPECWTCGNCDTVIDRTSCDQFQGKFFCKPCHIKVLAAAGGATTTTPAPAAPETKQVPGAPATASKPAPSATTSQGPSAKAPLNPVEEKKNPGATFYSYTQLKTDPPADVNRSKKETYLAPDVFEKLFQMTPEQFEKLKDWKKAKMKKAVGLW